MVQVKKRSGRVLTEVGNVRNWAVHWELLVIRSKTVAVGIRVGEQTGLEDWISTRLDTWNQVRRRESRLLDLYSGARTKIESISNSEPLFAFELVMEGGVPAK